MKQLYPTLTTEKLFFKEWPYKIATVIEGGGYLRYQGIDRLLSGKLRMFGWNKLSDQAYEELINFSKKIQPYLEKEVKFRVEGNSFNIFVKEETLFKELCQILEQYIMAVWQPKNLSELAVMLSDEKQVIVDNLPHKVYTQIGRAHV